MDASDAELVKRVLEGDRAAFGTLIERHRPTTLRLARRMLDDPVEAEDAAQEACLHAFLSLSRLRDPERFGAWLCGIAVNLSRMRLRARRDMPALEDWDGGRVARGFTWPEVQPSAEAAYEIRELHAIVLKAISVLPSEQQAVVRLHYLDGLTLAEIGVLAGAPLGTVKARLHRAREQLRVELAREFAGRNEVSSRKEKSKMIEVVVQDVVMRASKSKDAPEVEGAQPSPPPGPHRVALLKEKNGERLLPIWIGPHEADMLRLQMADKSAPRPLTYDLMVRLLELAQAAVERVAVSRLNSEVFYATLSVRVDGKTHELDARPSDALNLALRVKAPIFVAAEVMDAQAVQPDKLSARLASSLSQPEAEIEWVSVPAPDLKWPARPPEKGRGGGVTR
jgi:RNA polymerase sigma factor (sigma-70 family)